MPNALYFLDKQRGRDYNKSASQVEASERQVTSQFLLTESASSAERRVKRGECETAYGTTFTTQRAAVSGN